MRVNVGLEFIGWGSGCKVHDSGFRMQGVVKGFRG